MSGKPRIRSATVAATLAAGPAFLLSLGLYEWAQSAGAVWHIRPETLVASAAASVLAAVFGAILAVIPCLVGVGVLSTMATALHALRLPVAWGLVGALSGYAIGLPFSESGDGLAGVMALTGAVCALAGRSCLRWE